MPQLFSFQRRAPRKRKEKKKDNCDILSLCPSIVCRKNKNKNSE
jgi:hypothetical protein